MWDHEKLLFKLKKNKFVGGGGGGNAFFYFIEPTPTWKQEQENLD